ncbi:MAG TPA: hypothetical protein PLD59_05305 [Tepidisphaeraceae bacterium]|nr:hypothetical protein [Tepidisphaeraceae bacterium]
MSRPVSKLELIAFADGELSPARAAEVEAFLSTNPSLRAEIDSLRTLRSQAARTLRAEPQNPLLRQRVEALFDEPATSQPPTAHLVLPLAKRRWWASPKLAIAAAVMISLGVASWVILAPEGESGVAQGDRGELLIEFRDGRPPDGMPASMILVAVRKHLTCQQMSDHFYDSRFPRVLAELATPAAAFLGADPSLPDLSTIGYHFAGAGGCRITGGETLHALYRSDSPASEGISVFVQPFKGQVSFEAGQILVLAGPTSKHQMLAWRTESLLFYVVGDELAATERTAELMGQRL